MTTKQMSFADLEIVQGLRPDYVLVKLNTLMYWEGFRPLLKSASYAEAFRMNFELWMKVLRNGLGLYLSAKKINQLQPARNFLS